MSLTLFLLLESGISWLREYISQIPMSNASFPRDTVFKHPMGSVKAQMLHRDWITQSLMTRKYSWNYSARIQLKFDPRNVKIALLLFKKRAIAEEVLTWSRSERFKPREMSSGS